MLFTKDTSFGEIFENIRNLFSRAALEPEHPFRYMTISTHSSNHPNSRYVVLRGMDEDFQLLFYTDYRSDKIGEIENNPLVCLHFFHREELVQVKIIGEATIHHKNHLAAKHWENVKGEAKKSYTSILAPGTPMTRPDEAYIWNEALDSEYFTVIKVNSHQAELLQLNGSEHVRVLFQKVEKQWKPSWIAP